MKNYLNHLEQMYDKRTFAKKIDYIRYNFSEIFRNLNIKDSSFLEIGPGMGEFISYLNLRGVKKIDIVDNDKYVLEFAKKKYTIRNAILSNNIIQIENKLDKYDLIIMIQVLEHIPVEYYKKIMQILYKHLNTGGYIAIIVPNANNPLGLIERYGDLQHTGSFTEQSLKDLINISGIENYSIKIRGYEIPPYDFINIIRIILQKILHFFLLGIMMINGGIFFKTMTPNIMLILRKNSQ